MAESGIWRTCACLLALTVFAAGCGDDDGDERATTLSETTTSTTSAPEEPETTTTSTTAAPTPPVDQAALQAKLLTVTEMPSGWSQAPPDDEKEDADGDGTDLCAAAFEGLEDFGDDGGPEAEVSFQKGEPSLFGGVFAVQTLASSDADRLEEQFEQLPQGFEQCREFEETDSEGQVTKGSFSPLSFDKFGDETFALHMTGEVSSPDGFNFPLNGDVIFIREGSIALVVAIFGFGAAAASPDETRQIVEAAVAKL